MNTPKNHPLLLVRQLDLNTGKIVEVKTGGPVTDLSNYFRTIDRLNKEAHIYGTVFLATPDALDAIANNGNPELRLTFPDGNHT